MAKFNVDRGGLVLDSPVSGTFDEGNVLGLAANGKWTVMPGKYYPVRFVTAGYKSTRDDVSLLGIARLVFGPMLITTDQVWGTIGLNDGVSASGGKLIAETDPASIIGHCVNVQGNLYTIQLFK